MRSLFFSLMLACVSANAQRTNILVDTNLHHLGAKEEKAFGPALLKAEGARLDVTFEATINSSEWTLQLDQRNVTEDWGIEINTQRVARLNIVNPATTAYFSIPPRTLLDGENKLSIVPASPGDEILVGKIEITPQALRDVRKLGHVMVSAVDKGTKRPIPARITIANKEKVYADLYNVSPSGAAWRNGIIYTGEYPVEFDLPQGDWIISATRGMEWNHPIVPLRMFIGQNAAIMLEMQQEVDTTGYIAADTHIHTYTFSRHGDATLDERLLSLASEGVEFAVATDHNHVTDYKPRQSALALNKFYTSVPGNEVTTANGHFNGFPFKLDAKTPSTKETNWVTLVENIRTAGAQYVILNHPRWPTITNSPFAKWGLNRADGVRTNEMRFTADATEVVNSTVPVKDGYFMLRDWFALWNRGEHLWGVGASDTHTVHDVVGQGRTYIPSATDDPASINVDAVIKQMQAGNMSVSYGIFGYATVNDVKMGGLVKPSGSSLDVRFHIAAPSWISPTQAVVYVNGLKTAETNLTAATGLPFVSDLQFSIPTPANDAHVICVAYGAGVSDPAWPTYAKYTLAVANPIFIDANRDGKYLSPRETALAAMEKLNPISNAAIERALKDVDAAIAVQILSEAKLRLPVAELSGWTNLVQKLGPRNELFAIFRDSSAGPEPK